jgi:hypothetical protein
MLKEIHCNAIGPSRPLGVWRARKHRKHGMESETPDVKQQRFDKVACMRRLTSTVMIVFTLAVGDSDKRGSVHLVHIPPCLEPGYHCRRPVFDQSRV